MNNDIYELIAKRQSDREFDATRPVTQDKIARIIEAARLAPSACNSQPWRFVVVTEPEKCAQVADALTSMGMNKFGSQAPVHIIVIEESPNFSARLGGWVKNKHFPLIDCGIATSNITLAATAEGLGSCILGWFDEKKLKKVLGIPKSKRILLDILIGYSLQPHRDKQRKSTEEIYSQNSF